MRAIGMYGYVDKYDFVMAVAKTITMMGRSVLVVDATSDNKYKYIVPNISNDVRYINQYGEVDFAMGFNSYEELQQYMAEKGMDIEKYSYVLFDVESVDKFKAYASKTMDKSYLFIASNLVSVNKTEEIVRSVYYRSYMTRAANNYLDEKVANYAVNWSDEIYDVSQDEQDTMVNIDSQYSGLIDIRKHTKQYILYLCEFVSKLLGDEDEKTILKEIKRRKN